MGLMKTLSLSSQELKSILDRLTALESGETFATKEMFESLKNANNSDNIMLANYPIGSIYLSVDSSNPSTKFGGTWVAWGAGRVPVGVNETDSDFNAVEKTGGEKAHTLTQNELPVNLEVVAPVTYSTVGEGTGNSKAVWEYVDTGSRITLDVGLGFSHNNLQPYITCYMWKRTA